MISAARLVGVFALLVLLWPAAASAQGVPKCSTGTVNDVQHEWCKRLAAGVEQASKGELKMQVFPAGQLGGTPQQIQGVGLGTIEVFIAPPDFLVGIDPRFMVMTSPYLFDSLDHAHRVLNDPEVIDKFLPMGEARGYKGLNMVVTGPVGIATRTPVRTPDDLRGKKIRINATPIEQAMMASFGASGVPMGLVEALAAAQQGVVDGVQSGLPAIANFKFFDVTKYHADTQHFYITSIGVASKRWFDSLSPAHQQIVVKEARAANADLLTFAKGAMTRAKEAWIAGSKDGWIDLTAEQKGLFRARIEGIDAKIAQDHPQVKDMLELVRRKAKELR